MVNGGYIGPDALELGIAVVTTEGHVRFFVGPPLIGFAAQVVSNGQVFGLSLPHV